MNKKLLRLLTLCLCSLSGYAQDQEAITGYYRSPGPSILLVDRDHHFYIIAYATFIHGRWTVEGNRVKLIPKNPEHPFELYGRYNPNIREGYRIKFYGFEKNQTFIGKAGSDTMQRVFNLDPNCFDDSYVHQFPDATSFSFADSIRTDEPGQRETYTFQRGRHNDFIAVYRDPEKSTKEMIFDIGGGTENPFSDGAYVSLEKAEQDEKLKQEVMELRELGRKNRNEENVFFCNPTYRSFDTTAVSFQQNYTFNKAKNAYVSKHNYEKDEEIHPEKKNNAYHSIGIIFKYEKIAPAGIVATPFKIQEKSLFTAKCGGEE